MQSSNPRSLLFVRRYCRARTAAAFNLAAARRECARLLAFLQHAEWYGFPTAAETTRRRGARRRAAILSGITSLPVALGVRLSGGSGDAGCFIHQ
ncbi:MAG TPA: hypothetical protein VLB69_12380 [Rudaea sp.]|nr:hypothetical protein [Rudaea sp.]